MAVDVLLSAAPDKRSFVYEELPIGRCPHEILAKMFLVYQDSYYHGHFGSNAGLRLSRVCRIWRFVALNTPQLWNTICVGQHYHRSNVTLPIALIEAQIVRCGSAPLHFSIRLPSKDLRPSSRLSAILSHVSRSRCLELTADEYASPINTILRPCLLQSATYLETLRVKSGSKDIRVKFKSAPRLKCAVLVGPFDWDNTSFTTSPLKELEFNSSGSLDWIPVALDCPLLEKLEITDLQISVPRELSSPADGLRKKIQTLVLSLLHPEEMEPLLKIFTPSSFLDINMLPKRGWAREHCKRAMSALLSASPYPRALVSSQRDFHKLTLIGSGKPKRVKVTGRAQETVEFLFLIPGSVQLSRLRQLSIDVTLKSIRDDVIPTAAQWERLFLALPGLESLSMCVHKLRLPSHFRIFEAFKNVEILPHLQEFILDCLALRLDVFDERGGDWPRYLKPLFTGIANRHSKGNPLARLVQRHFKIIEDDQCEVLRSYGCTLVTEDWISVADSEWWGAM